MVPAPATVPVPEPATKPVPVAPTPPPPAAPAPPAPTGTAAPPPAPEPGFPGHGVPTPPPGYRVAHPLPEPPAAPPRDAAPSAGAGEPRGGGVPGDAGVSAGASVSASASVPAANRLSPDAGEVPVFTPQPRVYRAVRDREVPSPPLSPPAAPGGPGSPVGAAGPAAAAPAGAPSQVTASPRPPEARRGRPLPVFSDLLAPSPEQSQHPAEAGGQVTTAAPPGAPGTIPHPRNPQPDAGAAPDASRPPGAAGPAPTDGSAAGTAEELDPKAGPPVGLIVGAVIAGAAVLVLAALGMPFLLSKLRPPAQGPTYAVGDCVVQDGDNAVIADCTEPQAYEIVSRVATATDCPDPTLPTVAAGEDVFCLEPVGADEEAGNGASGEQNSGEGDQSGEADQEASEEDAG